MNNKRNRKSQSNHSHNFGTGWGMSASACVFVSGRVCSSVKCIVPNSNR